MAAEQRSPQLLPLVVLVLTALGIDRSALGAWNCPEDSAADLWKCSANSQAPEPDQGATAPADGGAPSKPEPNSEDPRLHAGLTWDYCGPRPKRLGPSRLDPLPDDQSPILLSSDAAELQRNDNRILLSGRVEAQRGSQKLQAEQLIYDRDLDRVQASGELFLSQPGLRTLSVQGEWNTQSHQAWLTNASYRLEGINARGTAASAHLESKDLAHFQSVTYTPCAPGHQDWSLTAERLDLDRAAGEGVARDATLRFGDVPVFYTPYLSFPLDDRRKSGLLAPSLASSGRRGLDLQVPYYFNLAPDMDATLIPRIMTKRGMALGGEFRYLTEQQQGEIFAELVPSDRESEHEGVRGALSLKQTGQFGPRWSTDVQVNAVSDDDYLRDYGSDLKTTSVRNLERRGDLLYSGDGFQALARVQNFQTVDSTIAPADQPYSRMPQLWGYGAQFGPGGSVLELEAEDVYFRHDSKVEGNRLSLHPTASLPLKTSYGHLTPLATLYSSSYWLDHQTADQDTHLSSTIPSLSLDGGLVFERNLAWFGDQASQTLEPRIFYLYTPYNDQSEIPVFDSAELDFNFDSLFRNNRFSGRDRIGDANQLTLGLTSRIFADRSGHELLRTSLGQVLYFEDRKVQLVGSEEQDNSSAYVAEVAAQLDKSWSTRGTLMWDPNRSDEQVRKASATVRYKTPEQQLFNLGYRINHTDTNDDTDYKDAEFSFRWPMGSQVELVGRWLYSLRYDQTSEAFAGVEYGRCCWKVRALVRDYVDGTDGESQLGVMFQLELAGLGSLGNRIDQFLERGVYGYEIK